MEREGTWEGRDGGWMEDRKEDGRMCEGMDEWLVNGRTHRPTTNPRRGKGLRRRGPNNLLWGNHDYSSSNLCAQHQG